jgi:YebC/PmpR family DNA-binding regulatory protein
MSGHSKWSTIKHKKAAQDSKRGKVFGQISRQIRVAVKEGGGGDPNQNPSLRLALEKARAANIPKENINRAIERGLGKTAGGAQLSEVVYEGYGPGGVGVMVWAITDNRNRTGAEIRNIFEKAGGSLGQPGSAAYMFAHEAEGKVIVKVPLPIDDESTKQRILALIETLEEHDDIELVVSNLADA